MPGRPVTRNGDRSTGHTAGSCSWPPTNLIATNAPRVFVNRIQIGVQGDRFIEHRGTPCRTLHAGPQRAIAMGSRRVFAHGRQVARITDPVVCGDRVAQGSRNVFAGD